MKKIENFAIFDPVDPLKESFYLFFISKLTTEEVDV